MKVRDLIQELSRVDQNLDVYCYMEDERFTTRDKSFFLLDIQAIGTVDGHASRDADGAPNMTFGSSKGSRKIVTLDVTTDF